MIFFDTSAIFALADRSDAEHQRARKLFQEILGSKEELFTHNYILAESAALLQRRLGRTAAASFLREAKQFATVCIDEALHDKAVAYFSEQGRQKVSLVDYMSFVGMRQEHAVSAFAFDDDFKKAGFQCL